MNRHHFLFPIIGPSPQREIRYSQTTPRTGDKVDKRKSGKSLFLELVR